MAPWSETLLQLISSAVFRCCSCLFSFLSTLLWSSLLWVIDLPPRGSVDTLW